MEPSGSPATASIANRCCVCNRTYERQDHLSRHLKSHANARSHQCPDCGKGFNRADLLNRHRAAHAKNTGEAFRRRTGRACEACIKAKTKCDEDRPCKRCKTRNQLCEESEGRRSSLNRSPGHSTSPPLMLDVGNNQRVTCAGKDQQSSHFHGTSNIPPAEHGTTQLFNGTHQPTPLVPQHMADANLLLGLNDHTTVGGAATAFGDVPNDNQANFSFDNAGFPDFFEQIMMSEQVVGTQSLTAMPFDVSNLTQDLTFDACDFDFRFLASGLTRPPTAHGHHPQGVNTISSDETPQSDVQLRSEAFDRSPWSWDYWLPERNSHAFSGQEEINVQEDRVSASDQLTSSRTTIQLGHCTIDQAARDRMIRTVTQVTYHRLAMPSFPSLKLLEDLLHVFLIQDSNATDGFVHAASFDCGQTRTELLLAMVAAGARYIALPPVWKMGLVIQEVVRLAVSELFEHDNSTTRELQALQAMLLWLDIGVFSGFRRKTEIALSFLQPLVTMLSWSHNLQSVRYRVAMPALGDSDTVLVEKWEAWARQESFKRLVIHTFVHDSQVAIVNMRNPLLSAAQMQLPLPASRELWLAPNALAWANAYHKLKHPTQEDLPSMAHFFSNSRALEQLGASVDKPLCMLTACHGLGHEVWTFRQNARLLSDWQNKGRRDRWLAHQAQQRDLYDDLSTFSVYCDLHDDASPEITLTIELLMMSLHVDLEDVQTFSGKSGEEEARKVFPRIRTWTESGEARIAVRHAGQVYRIARRFEKTTLRDFYSVAFYHAALTMWVYGMVTSNAARNSGAHTPLHASPGIWNRDSFATPLAPRTFIDATDEKSAKAFTLLGQGTPGIQNLHSVFIPLSDPKSLMSTAEALLKSNFPQSSSGLPPLVDNLANLMSELGRLSGKY